MIETIDQARENVAAVLNAQPKIRAIVIETVMTARPTDFPIWAFQCAMRDALQGESDPCQYGHHESYYASGCCDVCGEWAADVPDGDPSDYDFEDDIDADYLDSLERDAIDGPEYWQESGAYALGY